MLPIYNINIDLTDQETGMYTVSLVDLPAVECNFLTFDKESPIALKFDSDKHIITGVALRADYPIYRNNRLGEHYVVFTKETIRNCVEKFSKLGFNNFVNIDHNENNYVDNITMIESFIIDKERGICPIEFSNIEDGSWIVSYKVNDLNLWDKIKSGEVKGFSIEGIFNYSDPVATEMKKTEQSTISIDELIEELISE